MKHILPILLLIFLVAPVTVFSQTKRILPPKNKSKLTNVDDFVDSSFNLYDKVFIYDSLRQAGIEIPPELEDEFSESALDDLLALEESAPEIIEDISNAPPLRKVKATANLNKVKKIFKYCTATIEKYLSKDKEVEE